MRQFFLFAFIALAHCGLGADGLGVNLGLGSVPISAGGAGKFSSLTVTGAAAFQGSTVGFFNTTPAAQPANTVDADKVLETIGLRASGGSRARDRYISVTGVNLNSAASDVATVTGLPAKWRMGSLIVFDASVSLTTATTSVYTGPTATGTAIYLNRALAALTAAAKFTTVTRETIATTDYQTATTLYVRCETAQGAAATASYWFEIIDLTP